MKKLIALFAALTITTGAALAQGQINFANAGAGGLNAPVYDIDGETPLFGSNFMAQLLYDDGTGNLVPLESSTTAFNVSPGLFLGGTVTLPDGFGAGARDVQVFAWDADRPGVEGFSDIISADFVVAPTPVNNLIGLESFSLVPEPSIFALAILGAGALFLRRRRNK